MSSCSPDKSVRVWDVLPGGVDAAAEAEGLPRLVAYKSMNVGQLFTLQCSPDVPFLLATAGDKG